MSVSRLIVGISGASGVVYGVRLLEALKSQPVEVHLVMSQAAKLILACETDFKAADVRALADHWHDNDDMGAAISSGSFQTIGMIVAPCSMRSLAEIAGGVTSGLLTRAADVVLKERRRLVLMVRESPLHAGHIRNMLTVSDLGAIVAPPMPAFYPGPKSLEEVVDHGVGRVLDLFGLETGKVRRWGGKRSRKKGPRERRRNT